MKQSIPLILSGSLALAGCAVGPDYERPEVVGLGDAFEGTGPTTRATTRPADLTTWWDRLGDPQLTELVVDALDRSPDVEEAFGRVLESRALLEAASGQRLPFVDAQAGYTRSRTSENLDGFSGLAAGGTSGGGTSGGEAVDGDGSSIGSAFDAETDIYTLGLGATWEIDLFGRLKRRVQAAGRQFEADRFDLADVRVTLAADVATAYVNVRELQNRLRIARENVALQERSLEIARARFESGLTTELDVAQAVANLQQTRSTIPEFERGLRVAKNALAVLIGRRPGTLDGEVAVEMPVPRADATIATGVPADLLRRRPDIRRAERELAAAVAEIGAAEADLYPRLSLAGTFGLAAGDLDDLFDWDSRTFDVGPQLAWPIFQGGTLRALVAAADGRRVQEVANYRRTILTALRETSDAVASLSRDRDRREILGQSVEAAQRAVELADAQYGDGLIDFDRVIATQQTLFTAQDALAAADAAVTVDLITLYRALGGGWQPPPLIDNDMASTTP